MLEATKPTDAINSVTTIELGNGVKMQVMHGLAIPENEIPGLIGQIVGASEQEPTLSKVKDRDAEAQIRAGNVHLAKVDDQNAGFIMSIPIHTKSQDWTWISTVYVDPAFRRSTFPEGHPLKEQSVGHTMWDATLNVLGEDRNLFFDTVAPAMSNYAVRAGFVEVGYGEVPLTVQKTVAMKQLRADPIGFVAGTIADTLGLSKKDNGQGEYKMFIRRAA